MRYLCPRQFLISASVACVLVAAALGAPAAAVAQGQEPAAFGVAGFVYTADERGNSVTAIDLAAGRVQTVPVPISPHNVQITADGERLLAVGAPAADHGHGDDEATHGGETAGRLLVLDANDLAAGPVAEITVGNHPAHVVADQQGRRAFVTNSDEDSITVVDLDAYAVIGTIPTGKYPHGLRISPDGGEIYVANVEDGSLSVIDTVTLVETARIEIGKAPVQVAFTPNGSRVYASLRDENRVVVVDTATRAVVDRIDVGRNPIQLHATPNGRFVYVANQGTDDQPADTVSVIEVATGSVVDTIRTGNGAHGVAVSSDGGLVFVTNIVDATVSAIDAATREVATTFAVGSGPNGITFRPAAVAGAGHEAHHPAPPQATLAPGAGIPGAPPAEVIKGGMPGMMGMMTPEMMQMMHVMMQGGEPGRPSMFPCPMMRSMAGMPSDASPQAMMGEPGVGPGALYGMPAAAQEEMTPERVRAWLEQRLAWHGNPRLKIGEIAAAGEATVTAEILTVDGSLVQKLAFNRYPGLVRQLAE